MNYDTNYRKINGYLLIYIIHSMMNRKGFYEKNDNHIS